ncbi:tRNA lysidine(34) synthetase TilS [Paraflavitalea sp. CAU 1676]|uniref:tRNA lysidine(34) synthetase TilS n=1 Tax=Paraflavitalea sp. CAU 1676 TaxID=3032598 RepID=UPI0023DC4DBD|nr:tRNA lysidine(34) synthetase TilS [Paraflavitalea sp. CAU 1676]MDF2191425.1 tRNA lysidine(34) synthetase TilS [Paraflavitalea sp. CAU 1676]
MDFQKRFTEFVEREHLFNRRDVLLLAVSGGVDSAVLCALCAAAGYDFVIVHCNFQLRGAESDRDEAFVRSLAAKYDKPVLVRSFDTKAYADEHKVSIQVAARELRYAWFRSLVAVESSNLSCIVTAHHLDDNIETVLMNFFKGTGIAGMRGILPKQAMVVRPLLFATKEELVEFARQEQLTWVEDSSNAQDKYSRNYLRHQVAPLLQKIYPEVMTNLADNISRFRDVETLYQESVVHHVKKLLEVKGNEIHIPVLKLKKAPAAATLLYEMAKPFGFSPAQTGDMLALLDSETGRYVASASHRIFRNRNWLIIAPLANEEATHVLVEGPEGQVDFAGGQLTIRSVSLADVPVITPATSAAEPAATGKKKKGAGKAEVPSPYNPVAYVDSRLLEFPLLLRRWKTGDYFYPLGMQKKKKVARFLIDLKLSQTDKEKVWVLECNKRIVWVVGMRIDDRFKITPHTQVVIELSAKTDANS